MTFPGGDAVPSSHLYPGAGAPWVPFVPTHAPTAPSQDVFTVYAYDLNQNTKLAELPMAALGFDRRLNDSGAFTGSLQLDDPGVAAAAAPVLSLHRAPFALYVDRDGVIVWSGIGWTGQYQKSTGRLAIGGKEFLSYFDSRTIAANYDVTTYPKGIDPAQLMLLAINDAQSTAKCGAGASIGLLVAGGTSSIPKYVPGYSKFQYTTVAQVISDVTASTTPGTGGVDLTVVSTWTDARGGTPQTTVTIKSPRAGRSAAQTGLIFDLSTVIDFTWPWDAMQSGTQITAVGAGTGPQQPTGHAVSAQPVGGLGQYPRLDLVASFPQVQSPGQLAVMANGLARTNGQAVTTPTVTIPTTYQPNGLGSWLIGDDARLYCPVASGTVLGDPFFPNGLDEYWRIVQESVQVPDGGVPQVTLTFNVPPVY